MKPGPKVDFWANVDKENGPVHPTLGRCWIWTAAREPDGRGAAWRDGKKVGAPRFAWEEIHGGTSLWILHHCDNPSCVRPDHLYAGTHANNNGDRVRRGRSSRGLVHGAHWRAKTHCPKGHPYDEANTCFKKPTTRQKTRRSCRACAREYMRERTRQRRAAELGGDA